MNFEILNLTLSARTTDECKRTQLIIRDLVEEKDVDISKIRTIGGVDVSYNDDYGIGVLVVVGISDFSVIEQVVSRSKISFPYIPNKFQNLRVIWV